MAQTFRPLGFRLRTLQIAIFLGILCIAAVASGQPSVPAKRPLTHADYDGWKSVQVPTLSRDGRFLAYNLMPSDADGEFVVRNLATGGEHRVGRGKIGPASAVTSNPRASVRGSAKASAKDRRRRALPSIRWLGRRTSSHRTARRSSLH
jgi:hypothetical protein